VVFHESTVYIQYKNSIDYIIYIRIHEPCDTVGPWQWVPAAQANKTTAIVAAAVAQRGSKWEENHPVFSIHFAMLLMF